MPRTFGHKKGAENVVKITRAMKESGVKYLTLYAFSTENWQRSKDEVDALMQLLNEYLDKELKEIMDNNVRIVFIGERYMLSDSIQAKMTFLEKESEKNTDLTLCIALSYGSRQEILSAVKKIAAKVKEGSMDISQITQDVFSEELYTKEIPDPEPGGDSGRFDGGFAQSVCAVYREGIFGGRRCAGYENRGSSGDSGCDPPPVSGREAGGFLRNGTGYFAEIGRRADPPARGGTRNRLCGRGIRRQ